MRPRRRSCREEIGHSRLAVNTALAHVFRSGEILGLYGTCIHMPKQEEPMRNVPWMALIFLAI